MTKERLSLYSEPYGATGNIGENFQRLLGTHSLDPLQTVMREAVQNIADAAKLGVGPDIEIRLRRLTSAQQGVLASRVIRRAPAQSKALHTAMRSHQRFVVMEICDFGTVGLGGPTRADRIPADAKHTDFIDFLRNVGTARDTPHGGGTYGFGKVALFRASRCNTIVVDSLPQGSGPEGRRLIACHLGPSYEVLEDGMRSRFTGRHWWGIRNPRDGIADPVTGDGAAALASELGFPERHSDRSGTSVMILHFDTGGEDVDLIGRRVVENLLWSFWPRMMRDAPTDLQFKCRVEVNGSSLAIPSPDDFPPLDLFAKAMRAVRSQAGNDVRSISSLRPRKALGTLAVERGLRTPRRPLVEGGSLFPVVSQHIALMRPVELVVKYLKGNALPDERLEWAGVFVTSRDDEVERAFADSEPPAHDDWRPHSLPRGNSRRYVNIALRRLKEAATNMGLTGGGHPPATEASPPLARLARRLGSVLDSTRDVSKERRARGSRRRPVRARATRPRFERLELTPSGRVAVFSTEVNQDAKGSGAVLSARAAVAIEGSRRADMDGDFRQPTVDGIRAIDGSLSARGARLELAGAEGLFEIQVLVPDDCAAIVEAKVLTGPNG